MKKIILLCLVILELVGCGKIRDDAQVEDKTDIKVFQKDVVMSVKEGTLTNTGATVILKNDSDKDLQYCNRYKIEVRKDDEWRDVEGEAIFTLPAFGLMAKESVEIKLYWEHSYGKLPKGTYRIIKSIDYEYEKENYQSFDVEVEFVIE